MLYGFLPYVFQIQASCTQALIDTNFNAALIFFVHYRCNIHADHEYAVVRAACAGATHYVRLFHQICKADIHYQQDLVFILAAEYGHLECVKYLVLQNADVEAQRNAAIRRAAGRGHVDVVQFLSFHGANIHAGNDDCMIRAAENNQVVMMRFLYRMGVRSCVRALSRAAYWGHIEAVECLKDFLPQFDVYTTALSWACAGGQMRLAQYLLDRGACVNGSTAMDFFGPPLSWAAWNGSFELVDFLINEGADVTAHQNTALRMAALHRQLLIVQRLLSAGADPLAIETTE